MEYFIYWLISEDSKNTYIGFSENICRRVREHRAGQVNTTKHFGKFKCYILERANNLETALIREKYWKSCAGRKKLKVYYYKLNILASSSNG
ncbi:MAG: GIY-YIG nuclease family protein [Patescibacteria group bacterium]